MTAPARDKPLVLVADDDVTLRLLTREALEHSGFAVAEAEDGAEALNVFARTQPDIVVLDDMLPGLDGFEVCSRLRQDPDGAQVPVVMITAADDTESISGAYDAGATDFVTRPIDWLILGHRMRYILRGSHALAQLRESKVHLEKAHRIAHLGSWEWDDSETALNCSAEVYRILGLEPETDPLPYDRLLAAVHTDDRETVAQALRATRAGDAPNLDHRIVTAAGEERVVSQRLEVSGADPGRGRRVSAIIQDITELRKAEEQIHFLAFYDKLTHLPNRRLLNERLDHTLVQAKRYQRLAGALVVDLDRFKRINETLGHAVGDSLLKSVADRLIGCLRDADTVARFGEEGASGAVARLEGDEFTILLPEIARAPDASKVARRILESVATPLHHDGHEVVVTASIGIAVYPYDGESAEALLTNAVAAMYEAKDRGRNNYQYYSSSMNSAAFERLVLENELRKALKKDSLVMHYQPQIDVATGDINGGEALVRWQHPQMGLVAPNEFIPLAEETGLIASIGEWGLRTACAQCKAWESADFGPIRVAVNLSSQQLKQNGLVDAVEAALRETGLDGRLLELEITESLLMHNLEESVAQLRRCKAMGVTIAIDDFGTGYSSLNYLKRFPIDRLKIDRSFIKGIPEDRDGAAITAAIIALAHSLNLKVIAEGVETEEQLAALREFGCDEVQGYLFSPAVPAEGFPELDRPPQGTPPFPGRRGRSDDAGARIVSVDQFRRTR